MDLKRLLKLEGLIVTAWCTILNNAGGEAIPEFSDGDPDGKKTPLYEAKLINVKEDGKQFLFHGVKVAREWTATLITRDVTKRYVNSAEQADMAARVRVESFHFVERFESLLPYHYITFMREITSVPNHQPEGQFDTTEHHHALRIEIREEVLQQFLQAL